jgi:hypothetical protein
MLSHVFLHVALCSAILQQPPDTTVAMHVRMVYPMRHTGAVKFEQTYTFKRESDPQTVVEFDIEPGLYALEIDAPKYGCSSRDFLELLTDHNRTVKETLVAGVPPLEPVLLLEGAAPLSFQSVKPTFVLLDKSVACNKPVGTPVSSHIVVENDLDGYYVWLYFDSVTDPEPGSVVLAFRLATSTGLFHYVRLKVPFPQPWGGWPSTVRFDVTEEMIDGLSTEKTDTLLCPKLWQTSAG